jgi:hypothetical protein
MILPTETVGTHFHPAQAKACAARPPPLRPRHSSPNLRHRQCRRFHSRQQGRPALPRPRFHFGNTPRRPRRPAPHPGRQARLEVDALFADFKDIARTSRAIAIEEPGFSSAAFRFPADYTEATATTHADSLLTLLEDNTAAGGDTPAQLAAKAALRVQFIAFELPADFVVDLRTDRDALDGSNSGKHSDNFEGVESTAATPPPAP